MTSLLLADGGQGGLRQALGGGAGGPRAAELPDGGPEPGAHAEVDEEVDGGVGHLAHVGQRLDDGEGVAQLACNVPHTDSAITDQFL